MPRSTTEQAKPPALVLTAFLAEPHAPRGVPSDPIDRQIRELWRQYAQALTAIGYDLRAKAVYDWLLSNPAQKTVVPAGFDGQ